jgi:predicted lysophospholipase L1 biosynthesis ABC-type transport system permease subunit
MPRAFEFPSSDERMWLPLPDGWQAQPRSAHFLGAVGRVRPGVTLDAARHDLRSVAKALEIAYPDSNRGWGVTVVSLGTPALTLVVRGSGDPSALAAAVRDVVHSLDAGLPLSNVRSLADLVAGSTASRRLSAVALSLVAALAAALTLVGVYGVVSQLVAQSTRELGVRIALGASRRDVMSLVMRRALKTAALGVVAGWLLAWFAAPALRGMLYGVAPRDPATFVVVAFVLLNAAALTAYLPARRILGLDVLVALRVE